MLNLFACSESVPESKIDSDLGLITLSQHFLKDARYQNPLDPYFAAFAKLNMNELTQALNNDTAKKTFWLNIYNALVQYELRNRPEQYAKKGTFFKKPLLNMGGVSLSMDDIEHGILRRSRNKYSFGYFGKIFVPKWEKEWRVDKIDHRIHFALNCGAKSCPPIVFYTEDRLTNQLNLAQSVYLKSSATYLPDKDEVWVPAILSWFRADFGGKEGIRVLLQELEIIPKNSKPKVKFLEYDWTLYLENFND